MDKKAGKKTIVMITSGGSVNVTPWKDDVDGIFETWYAGEEGGVAAARLLFGEANPSGHLPISWEKQITDNPSYAHYYPDAGTNKIVYREGIFMGYRGYEHNHVEPQYPFGFGLSYTTFKFGNLKSTPTGDGRLLCDLRCNKYRAACRCDRSAALRWRDLALGGAACEGAEGLRARRCWSRARPSR